MAQPRIVAIDDDDNILKLIVAILRRDYEVISFGDAAEALDHLRRGLTPELIVCDVNMPGLDGFSLHQALREVPRLRQVPFIFLTAFDSREMFRRGMTQGADDYITKPFSPAELRGAVAVRLARRQLLAGERGIDIDSLGGVRVLCDQQTVRYEAKKVIELLLYLYVQGQAIPLAAVRQALWAEPVGDNTLYVLVNRTRKAFGPALSLTVRDELLELALHSPLRWDAEVFEASARAARKHPSYSAAEHAIAQFKGEFLPGFDAPWTEQQRSYYDALYLEMLELSLAHAPNAAARRSSEARLEAFLGR